MLRAGESIKAIPLGLRKRRAGAVPDPRVGAAPAAPLEVAVWRGFWGDQRHFGLLGAPAVRAEGFGEDLGCFGGFLRIPGVGSAEMATGSVPRTESWPLCRSAQADSMSSGRCGRHLRDASPSSTSSGAVPLAAGRSRTSKPSPSEADFARGAIVCRCARGRVGWQKLSGGVGLRRSLLVAAESETRGLAPSGKPPRAKGRRESALGAGALKVEERLARVSGRRKASRVVEAVTFLRGGGWSDLDRASKAGEKSRRSSSGDGASEIGVSGGSMV